MEGEKEGDKKWLGRGHGTFHVPPMRKKTKEEYKPESRAQLLSEARSRGNFGRRWHPEEKTPKGGGVSPVVVGEDIERKAISHPQRGVYQLLSIK